MRKTAVYAALVTVFLLALGVGSFAIAGGSESFGTTGKNKVKSEELIGYHEGATNVSSTAIGEFAATIDDESQTIEYTLTYEGLEAPVLFAHIHLGNRYVAGGVSAFLCGGGTKPACPQAGTVTGTVTAADVIGPTAQGIEPGRMDELIRAIRAGATYVNVHTTKFPGGEIRAQINDENQRQP
jgi:hypothetical protein